MSEVLLARHQELNLGYYSMLNHIHREVLILFPEIIEKQKIVQCQVTEQLLKLSIWSRIINLESLNNEQHRYINFTRANQSSFNFQPDWWYYIIMDRSSYITYYGSYQI